MADAPYCFPRSGYYQLFVVPSTPCPCGESDLWLVSKGHRPVLYFPAQAGNPVEAATPEERAEGIPAYGLAYKEAPGCARAAEMKKRDPISVSGRTIVHEPTAETALLPKVNRSRANE